jgi:YfiH family protein
MRISCFSLEFREVPGCGPGFLFASFPFIMEGEVLGGISCGLSSRAAGDMAFRGREENPGRSALLRGLNLDPRRVFGLSQTHSREVLPVAGDGLPNPDLKGDGLVCSRRDVFLSVSVADCLPVYLYDTESGAFGLLHSGWKGTGIVLRALSLMTERWGTRPEAVTAVLGPCICPCCYRVDRDRAADFEAGFGSAGPGGAEAFPPGRVTRQWETPGGETVFSLDLQAANVRLLAGAGLRNITVCRDCTFTDERLGSFRREGAAYTRMMALTGYFLP